METLCSFLAPYPSACCLIIFALRQFYNLGFSLRWVCRIENSQLQSGRQAGVVIWHLVRHACCCYRTLSMSETHNLATWLGGQTILQGLAREDALSTAAYFTVKCCMILCVKLGADLHVLWCYTTLSSVNLHSACSLANVEIGFHEL